MPVPNQSTRTKQQHAVPQNVLDVEFKIVGNLTTRQFFYVAITCVLGYTFFNAYTGPLRWPFIIFIVVFGLCLAFVPVQDRGLDLWIASFFGAIFRPTQFVWRKSPEIPLAFTYSSELGLKENLVNLVPTTSRRKLEEFLEKTDEQEIDPLDISELRFVEQIRDVYKDTPTTAQTYYYEQSLQQNQFTQTEISPAQQQIEETGLVNQPIPEDNYNPAQEYADNVLKAKEEEIKTTTSNDVQPIQQATNQATFVPQEIQQPTTPIKTEPQINAEQPKVSEQRQSPASKANAILRPIQSYIQSKVAANNAGAPSGAQRRLAPRPIAPSSLTPDRRSGRVFTNLIPRMAIRGERVLKTSAEILVEQEIDQKASQLKQLLSQIKTAETPNVPVNKTPITQANIIDYKNNDQAQTPQQLAQAAEQTITNNPQINNVELNKTYNEFNETLQKQQDLNNLPPVQKVINTQITQPAQPAQINALTNKPDIISGIVLNEAEKTLDAVLVVIKNAQQEPIRAIKTNSLGQFFISTPLEKGSYTVEIDKNKKTGLNFDNINVVVNGSVLPPYKFIGRLA